MPKKKRKAYHLLTFSGKWKRTKEREEYTDDFLSDSSDESDRFLVERNPLAYTNDPGPSTSSQTGTNYFRSSESVDEDVQNVNIFSSENTKVDENSWDDDLIQEPFSEVTDTDDDDDESSDSRNELNIVTTALKPIDSDKTLEVDKIQLFLKQWAIEKNITTSALSSLCAGLQKHHPVCFSSLNCDGRTILKTPINLVVQNVSPGQYIHIGLEKQLKTIVTQLIKSDIYFNNLNLLFNVDGLPLFRSSPGELYPILFSIPSIPEIKNNVYPVGLYYGPKKPNDLTEFLQPFLDELVTLVENGLIYNEDKIDVFVLGFCCDVPAKSFLLGITSHTGYRSCTRCKVHGITVERRRVFLETDCPLRTHEEFVNRSDMVFQPRVTPLLSIPGLDLTCSFAIDYMHLICLGVMRTLLFIWCTGPLPLRLSPTQRSVMSENLLTFRNDIPAEFARKPRELTHIKLWKATEYRMFLLYYGPLILKDILSTEKYTNFLMLHVATTILLTPKKCSDSLVLNYAKELLVHFVSGVQSLYGEMYISHNFHNLIHVADDVTFFSSKIPNFSLHSVSAFPFENFLQTLKRKVRGRAKPLQQIGKRLGEEFSNTVERVLMRKEEQGISYATKHQDGPLPAFCVGPQYKKMVFKQFLVTSTHPNNCCRLRNGTIIIVENFAYSNELQEQVVVGKKFLKLEDFYGEPLCPSSELGIFRVKNLSGRRVWPVKSVNSKCMLLKLEGKLTVIPLLHCEVTH